MSAYVGIGKLDRSVNAVLTWLKISRLYALASQMFLVENALGIGVKTELKDGVKVNDRILTSAFIIFGYATDE